MYRVSGFPQESINKLGRWMAAYRRTLALLLMSALICVLAAVTLGILVADAADSDDVDATAGPKWLDEFCIGNERCLVGDFNGDGKSDVAALYSDSKSEPERGDVYVALSTGTAFQAPVKWSESLCLGSEQCKVGDFNGDKKDDLVAFKYGSGSQVAVALSDGGAFGGTSVWKSDFCGGAEVCDVGDFDGNGADDIVAFTRSVYAPSLYGRVWVALSNSLNAFGSATVWRDSYFCIEQEQCGTGDFNGDKYDDVVAFTRGSTADVFVALSNVPGNQYNFAAGTKWHDFFCAANESCATGEFTGDGRDDVVAFLRDGYDEESKGDVFVGVSWSSSFAADPRWHPDFCLANEVCAVGDFDGDKRDDIVRFFRDTRLDSYRGDVWVALAAGHASGFFPTPGSPPGKWSDNLCNGNEECLTGDVNGDGRADAVSLIRDTQAGAGQGDVFVGLSTGTAFGGTSKWHDFYCTGSEVCRLGDFNGDGRDDLISFKYAGGSGVAVALARSDAPGFGALTVWKPDFCPGGEVCEVGDVNGDGKDDIVAFTRSVYAPGLYGRVWVSLSTGSGFGAATIWRDSWFCIEQEQCGVGDFNGDGRDDVVTFTHGDSVDVWVALSNGANGFGASSKWHDFFCAGAEVCAVGDFNGDGMDDVVTFLRSSWPSNPESYGDVFVGTSTGAAFRDGRWQDFFCLGSELCRTGDFDGDGKMDIATFLRSSDSGKLGDVYVALAQGGGHFRYLGHLYPILVHLPYARR